MVDDGKGAKKPKAKRPDVRERLLSQKYKVSTTVKASLSGRLAPCLPDTTRRLLHDEIDSWVMSTSKITHRLSIIWNRLILYCLDEDIPLPPIEQAVFTGIALSGMKVNNKRSAVGYSTLIDAFVENEFTHFPEIQRQRGDCQAINIAAKKYMTNFKNACWVPFFDRQKAFVYLWCELNKVEEAADVLYAINGWVKSRRT